ncbi:hypothetical protein D3C80_20850 [compost metagenome]
MIKRLSVMMIGPENSGVCCGCIGTPDDNRAIVGLIASSRSLAVANWCLQSIGCGPDFWLSIGASVAGGGLWCSGGLP